MILNEPWETVPFVNKCENESIISEEFFYIDILHQTVL